MEWKGSAGLQTPVLGGAGAGLGALLNDGTGLGLLLVQPEVLSEDISPALKDIKAAG